MEEHDIQCTCYDCLHAEGYGQTLRSVMEKLAAAEPYYSEQPEGWYCMLCDGWHPEQWSPYPDGGKSQFQHDSDCPVTFARTWLAAQAGDVNVTH
jgi:hypothetical protein